MIKIDLETAAVYGTKHGSDDTSKFFRQKLQDRGYDFNPENFNFNKDRNNTVSIKWIYQDEISFFGSVIKKLEFKLEVTQREIKEIL